MKSTRPRMHWKRSEAENIAVFPDLRIRRVREIVASGGTIKADLSNRGEYLEPKDFHCILSEATDGDDLNLGWDLGLGICVGFVGFCGGIS